MQGRGNWICILLLDFLASFLEKFCYNVQHFQRLAKFYLEGIIFRKNTAIKIDDFLGWGRGQMGRRGSMGGSLNMIGESRFIILDF